MQRIEQDSAEPTFRNRDRHHHLERTISRPLAFLHFHFISHSIISAYVLFINRYKLNIYMLLLAALVSAQFANSHVRTVLCIPKYCVLV